jgi:hypothetical protein
MASSGGHLDNGVVLRHEDDDDDDDEVEHRFTNKQIVTCAPSS